MGSASPRGWLSCLVMMGLIAGVVAVPGVAEVPEASAQSAPPAAPSSVTLTRGDGFIDVSWQPVDGATAYDIVYSTDDKVSWTRAATDVSDATTYRITGTDNLLSYVVAVRAGNSHGESDWTNSDRYDPAMSSAAAPASVTLERGNGFINVSWPAVPNATFDIVYSTDDKVSWTRADTGVSGATYTIPNTNNLLSYVVAVRAKNANGESGWTNSDRAGPVLTPSPARNVSLSRSSGMLTVTWDQCDAGQTWCNGGTAVTGYFINLSTDGRRSWTRIMESSTGLGTQMGTAPDPGFVRYSLTRNTGIYDNLPYVASVGIQNAVGVTWANSAQVAPSVSLGPVSSLTVHRGNTFLDVEWPHVTGATGYDVNYSADDKTSWTRALTNVSGGSGATRTARVTSIDNNKDYHVAIRPRALNSLGPWTDSVRSEPAIDPLPPWNLSVSRSDGALSVSWDQCDTGGDWCNGGSEITEFAINLRAGAGKPWTRAKTITDPATDSNLTITENGDFDRWRAEVSNSIIDNLTAYTVAVGVTNRMGTSWQNYGPLATLAVSNLASTGATLTLAGHTGDWYYQADKGPDSTCRGPVGSATRNVAELTPGVTYTYTAHRDSSCGAGTGVAVASFVTVSLTASGVTGAGATLTIANHSGGWWYERTDPTGDSTCHTVASGTAGVDLTGLDEGVTYTYEAYRDSGCVTRIAATKFTTASLAASSITSTSATLTLAGWSENWWLKPTAPANANCRSKGKTATEDLNTLTAGAAYTYVAYSDSTCSTEIARESFTAGKSLTASNVTATTATLTLAGETGNWWLKRILPAGDTMCSPKSTTYTADLTDLAPGTTYTYEAYDTTGCAEANEIATETFTTPASLTATGLTATTATLTLAGHTGDWWLKRTTPNDPACEKLTDSEKSLADLSPGTAYTYKAYSDSGCTTANELAAETFTTPASLTASKITATEATLTIAGHGSGWWYERTTPTGDDTCGSVTAGTSTADLAGLTRGTSYTYKAYSDSGCSTELAFESFTTVSLTASAVSDTSATLTLANHSITSWWLKRTHPADTACTQQTTTTETLSALTAGDLYGYAAHSDNGCANKLDTVYFSATDYGAGNLAEAESETVCDAGKAGSYLTKVCAVAFTTGSRSLGYTLSSVTGAFAAKTGSPGDLTVAIHKADTTNSANPAAEPLVVLTGSNPDTAGLHTFSCPASAGRDCDLAASSTYFVVMSTPDASGHNNYRLKATASSSEAKHPGTNGWSVADTGRIAVNGNWANLGAGRVGMLHFAVDEAVVRLNLTAVTSTTATLEVSGHSGNWYLQRTAPADTACKAKTTTTPADTRENLTNLTQNVDYTYKAYSDSACSTEIASLSFNTSATLIASSITTTTATLKLAGYTANWWLKRTHPADTACTAKTTQREDLTALTPGTSYTYKAYSDSTCTTEIAAETFKATAALAASDVTDTAATLAISNHSRGWWYKRTAPATPADSCHAAASATTTPRVSGLAPGTSHTFKAYSDSTCSTEIASVSFTTLASLTASSITATTATLTISGHSGNWWLKRTHPADTACAQNATAAASVASLTKGTLYQYTAYSDSTCTTALATEYFSASGYSVGNLAEKTNRNSHFGYDNILANQAAGGFTTGNRSLGYTLTNITGKFANKDGSPGTITVAIHEASGSHPAASPKVTLTGSDPDTAGLYTYTCPTASGAKCDLAASTTYYVVMSTPDTSGDHSYAWNQTHSDDQTGTSGWSIADTGNLKPIPPDTRIILEWQLNSDSATGLMHIAAENAVIRLAASNVTDTGARLTITNHDHSGSGWWYKASAWPHQTCSTQQTAATATLTGLSEGTDYTYRVYKNNGCATADEIAMVSFTTLKSFTASGVTDDEAQIILRGQSGSWWLKRTTPADNACTQKTATGKLTTVSLTSLTPDTDYTYKAYSNNSCSAEIITVSFKTLALKATGISSTGATLSLANRTGSWYYKADKGPDTTCSTAQTGNATLSGLTKNTTYTYTAYAANECKTQLATQTFKTPPVPWERNTTQEFNVQGLGLQVQGVWIDGSTMWVSTTNPAKLVAFSVANRTRDPSKDFNTLDAAGNDHPRGMWSNSTTMWVADKYDSKIYAYKKSTKERDSSKDFNTLKDEGNYDPRGIWSDGTTMWVSDATFTGIYAYNLSNKAFNQGKAIGSNIMNPNGTGNGTPTGIWSNGTTLWVADSTDDKLYAYSLSGGTRDSSKDFGTLNSEGNNSPTGVSGYLAGLWVADSSDDLVYAYNNSPGSSNYKNRLPDVEPILHGTPSGIWSNGTTIWVADPAADVAYAYHMSNKSRDSGKDFTGLSGAGNNSPRGLWSNGTTMWVVDSTDKKAYAYKMSDRTRDSGKDFNANCLATPAGIWSDHTTVWASNRHLASQTGNDQLCAYTLSSKSRDSGKDFTTLKNAGNRNPYGIWSNGTTMWVADPSDARIYAYSMSTKNRDTGKEKYLYNIGNKEPYGIWSNGTTTWITDYDDGKVYAYTGHGYFTISDIRATTATLTLSPHLGGTWYYKANKSPDNTCSSAQSGKTVSLTGLTANTSYTYTAYRDSSCSAHRQLASGSFTTRSS